MRLARADRKLGRGHIADNPTPGPTREVAVVCFYWIVRDSRSFSVVIVEQATESLPHGQPPVKALWRALHVVVSHVLADEFTQVSSPSGMTGLKLRSFRTVFLLSRV